ncbi:hypothetical protein HNQ35_000036 [Cerasibacillus quisquiliarum]|uniref:Uncharacterized protein n=1 Tax=Cerasibacillus quisquiliarum TaxID=227865 RepID=A0A511UUJ7_9BACI|nr:hypothetical protein [Cerasibacillus quisquiliarum]MBB5144847.1 hypothetical protein [Cerasibacillus quisquiliarum]GEN30260.1 hypothetical protein CQU01_04980 [Cerasibacillus quisquiliarum]
MKEQSIVRKIYIEQLNQLGYYNTEGKSNRQLAMILAAKTESQAREVNIASPENRWF